MGAIKAVIEATPNIPSHTIDVRENEITCVPSIEAVEMTPAVADALPPRTSQKATSAKILSEETSGGRTVIKTCLDGQEPSVPTNHFTDAR